MNNGRTYQFMIQVVGSKMAEQWCVRVPSGQGETVRQELIREGILDTTLKVHREGSELCIPVTSPRGGAERCEFELNPPRVELPRHELVGGIAIMQECDPAGAERILAARPSLHTVVCAEGEVAGEYRTRDFQVLAGKPGTRTEVIDYGHRFIVDLAAAYFSARLSTERQRIVAQVMAGELVLDMFAGVGPFAITLAERAEFVVAADLNPRAIGLMLENIARNRTENVLPLLADAHHLPRLLPWKSDRIVMNLPLSGTEFLADAFRLCKPGGTIHFYSLISAEGEHRDSIKDMGGEIMTERVVRSYSPTQWHAVYDIVVKQS
jgi:tRNA (guanine37-N1)-methyltransferase